MRGCSRLQDVTGVSCPSPITAKRHRLRIRYSLSLLLVLHLPTPHQMIRLLATSLLLASAAHGFGAINPAFHVYQGAIHPAPPGADTIDYDAPVDRLRAAGHLVEKATSKLDHDIVVDDDCYLGKDGRLDECVDFDPPAMMRSDLRNEQAKKYAGLIP